MAEQAPVTTLTTMSVAAAVTALPALMSLIEKSPLVSIVFFGFVLTVLEKLLEMQFVCPCESKNYTVFTVGIFVVPPFLIFLLMLFIQGYKEKSRSELGKTFLSSSVPVIVWLILLFFDGRYFVCLKTDWSGRFVTATVAAPWKWCEPTNSSSSSGDELHKTLQWYSQSQNIGMWIVTVLTSLYGLSIIFMYMYKKPCGGGGGGV